MTIESLFIKSAPAGSRLRVGLLFPPGSLPSPAFNILEHLHACDYVDIVAAIIVPTALPAATTTGPLLYRLYRWLDRLTSAATTRSLAPQSCATYLRSIALYAVDPDPSHAKLVLPQFQQSILASCRLDVILSLGSVPDPQALASVARCGVWICKLGDPILGDEQSSIFLNTVQQSPTTSVSLEAFVAGRATPVTLASASLSLATNISTIRNLVGPARMGVDFVSSKLWQLHNAGWDYVLAKCTVTAERLPAMRAFPTNTQMLVWASTKSVRHVRHRILQYNTNFLWRIALRHDSQQEGLSAACRYADYSWIDAPPGRYYADPFLISHAGQSYLFVEEFDVTANKGVISYMEINQGGALGPARVALTRPYHLSYPQVLAHAGQFYMIPESGFNSTVEIYRAVEFPMRWELAQVPFRGPAFDVTVLQHDHLFWFFVTLVDVRCPQSIQLVLFYSESLLGDWKLHPASPISSDIRVARCAGAPFRDRGTWIRPAQDGSETYGGALHYQRIVHICTKHYVEEPAGSLTPKMIPGSSGVHTYNRDGRFEAIDGKSRVILAEYFRDISRNSTR